LKPVCVGCQIEMRPHATGAFVEFMRSNPAWQEAGAEPKALGYQLYTCEVFQCPVCKAEAVTRFGATPIAQHFEANYEARVEDYKNIVGKVYVRAYERLADRPANPFINPAGREKIQTVHDVIRELLFGDSMPSPVTKEAMVVVLRDYVERNGTDRGGAWERVDAMLAKRKAVAQ
jgi:hypothetical protein